MRVCPKRSCEWLDQLIQNFLEKFSEYPGKELYVIPGVVTTLQDKRYAITNFKE